MEGIPLLLKRRHDDEVDALRHGIAHRASPGRIEQSKMARNPIGS